MPRRPYVLALALALCAAAASQAADAPQAQLTLALQKACPAKHLEFIAPGDFDGLVQGWEMAVTPAQHQRYFDLVSRLQPRCASTAIGLPCDNGVAAEAVLQSGLQDSFVAYACRSELVCTGQLDCRGSAIN